MVLHRGASKARNRSGYTVQVLHRRRELQQRRASREQVHEHT